MKGVMFKFLVFTLLLVPASYAQTSGNSIWGDAKTDQERCQAEADYMVKYRQFRHVGPCIGSVPPCRPSQLVMTEAVVVVEVGIGSRV